MNGDVRFEGPTADKGTYRVTTHNGDIRVSVGAQANATVFVRTFGGDFSSDFPVTLPEGMSNRDGNKRFNFTLGSGSARVELQSFQGDIHVSRAPLPPERQRRRGAAAHGPHDAAAIAAEAAAVEVERRRGRGRGRRGRARGRHRATAGRRAGRRGECAGGGRQDRHVGVATADRSPLERFGFGVGRTLQLRLEAALKSRPTSRRSSVVASESPV